MEGGADFSRSSLLKKVRQRAKALRPLAATLTSTSGVVGIVGAADARGATSAS